MEIELRVLERSLGNLERVLGHNGCKCRANFRARGLGGVGEGKLEVQALPEEVVREGPEPGVLHGGVHAPEASA